MNNNKLKFSPMKNNAKLAQLNLVGYSFSLPSGHTCPSADACRASVHVKKGKAFLKHGKNQKFVCFSSQTELIYKPVREQRFYNLSLLKKCKDISAMVSLIKDSIPKGRCDVIRIGVGGDYYSSDYFRSWMIVAELFPHIIFYSYTKSLQFIKDVFIPPNMHLNASVGGRFDHLIDELKLKYVKVVFSEQEAKDLDLEIDHDDSLAFKQDKPFSLLLHGNQRANTSASSALSQLRKDGIVGYSKKNNISRKLINSLIEV